MTPSTPLVLITGASGGIGQALARRYAAMNYRLALVVRQSNDVENWLKPMSISVNSYQIYSADVTQPHSMAAMAQDCLTHQGVPDIVIANAGISIGMDASNPGDMAVLQTILQTNVLGVAYTFQPFIVPMRTRGSGTLVGISSVAGIRGLPGHGGYCASKAAVISYCESLRGELRNTGVKVITLCPGYVETPMTHNNHYTMPFLMAAQNFAKQAVRAIAVQDSYRVIPWQMGVVAKLLRALPNGWFDRLLSGRPRKPRRPEF